jgi:hypothetical protein
VNKQGHKQSLVAAHPGNSNAAKSGFYSPRLLQGRIDEVEQAIANESVEDLGIEFYRSEIARLLVLRDAADEELSSGVVGRGGKPKALVDQRLRISRQLERLLSHYEAAAAAQATQTRGLVAMVEEEGEPEPVLALLSFIARPQRAVDISEVTAENFSPNAFLRAVLETEDQSVTTANRRRAQRLLAGRAGPSPETCLCYPEGPALDPGRFDEHVTLGRTPRLSHMDEDLAEAINCFAAGQRLDNEVWFRRARSTFQEILEAARDPSRVPKALATRAQPPPREERAHRNYWQTLLSPDPSVSARDRLAAFEGLDEMAALRRCTCSPHPFAYLDEGQYDAECTYVLLLLLQKDRLGAEAQGAFPKTHRALTAAREAAAAQESASSADA